MRAIAPLFSMTASVVTILAVLTRLWWSKPKMGTRTTSSGIREDYVVADPKAPSWLATVAKWWLITVFFSVTLGFLFFASYAVFSMST